MERVVEEEWLDDDRGTPEEIRAALHSITLVNQRFGGVRLHARLLRQALARASREHRPHILEVASGRADVLQAALLRIRGSAEASLISRLTAPRMLRFRVLRPRMSRCWTQAQSTCRTRAHGRRRFPHRVLSRAMLSTFLSPMQASISSPAVSFSIILNPSRSCAFLRKLSRVARVAVVINDLERTALHYRLAQLNRIIDRSRISRHDGPVSVRRAYTRQELAHMLQNTGRSFLLKRAWLYRLGAVLWCDPR